MGYCKTAVSTYVYTAAILDSEYRTALIPSNIYLYVLGQEYDTVGRCWSYVADENGQYDGYILDSMLTRVSSTPKPMATPTPKFTISLWVSDVTKDYISLSCKADKDGTPYDVQRREDGSDVWTTFGYSSYGSWSDFEDWDVTPGKTYHYRVVATDLDVVSNEVSASVPK